MVTLRMVTTSRRISLPLWAPSLWILVLALALAISQLACGGSSPSAASAESSAAGSSEMTSASATEAEDAAPAGPNCDDGTCFLCGDGICPVGAYCAATDSAPATCAWLPECAGAPDCACLTKNLGATCQCEMQGAAPLVTCE